MKKMQRDSCLMLEIPIDIPFGPASINHLRVGRFGLTI